MRCIAILQCRWYALKSSLNVHVHRSRVFQAGSHVSTVMAASSTSITATARRRGRDRDAANPSAACHRFATKIAARWHDGMTSWASLCAMTEIYIEIHSTVFDRFSHVRNSGVMQECITVYVFVLQVRQYTANAGS